MAGEFDPSRRKFIVDGLRWGAALVGATTIVAACDRANTMNVVQEERFRRLGLRGSIQMIDLRSIPAYENLKDGFTVHQETIKTPEPFSHEETHDFITFAWKTNSEAPQVAVSDIRLDMVKWETLPKDTTPFVTFDLAYSAFNSNTDDPRELLEKHLRSAIFHFSPEDLGTFRGDQSLLPN